MKNLLSLLFLVTTVALVGCNAEVAEQAPPSEAPTMTAEEKQDMESQMETMMKEQEKRTK